MSTELVRRAARIDAALAAGQCYCDHEYLCGVHSRAMHDAHAEVVSGGRAWPGSVALLVEQVKAESPAPRVVVRG